MKTESMGREDGVYSARLGASSKLLSLEVRMVSKRVGYLKKEGPLGQVACFEDYSGSENVFIGSTTTRATN